MQPTPRLASLLAGAALAGCAATTAPITPPPDQQRLMALAAHGVQIYECRATANAAPAWAFVAPEADLFDAQGRHAGRHGAGPFWEHADGSRFTGSVRARMDAPTAGAIPWLLLDAKPEAQPGAFSRVASVQRLHTVGGQPPATGCTSATLGQRVRMAYRADYVLFAPRA
ncbi:DUF3455 domain-containing protein [Ottowia sp.]|jgi:hypothetical protein|uniref:DUF3455 domain-containing protein n=1 Tax=Ottowia sp. TaxID=1898956 RepID=UPI0025F6A2B8|nr:DUF3455 domain-containing protein [Ottowia sp.]MBK6615832.1 DUF3455 domain-containing protein [Ottowia sp.]MBK6746880.1 DUF3455 domain-containing protein [Ottowia sp.]